MMPTNKESWATKQRQKRMEAIASAYHDGYVEGKPDTVHNILWAIIGGGSVALVSLLWLVF